MICGAREPREYSQSGSPAPGIHGLACPFGEGLALSGSQKGIQLYANSDFELFTVSTHAVRAPRKNKGLVCVLTVTDTCR